MILLYICWVEICENLDLSDFKVCDTEENLWFILLYYLILQNNSNQSDEVRQYDQWWQTLGVSII